MVDAATNEIVDVKGCQRCGRDHAGMIFTPLVNAVDRWRRWARCPVTNQPVMLAVVEGDGNGKPAKCPICHPEVDEVTAVVHDAGEDESEATRRTLEACNSIEQILGEVE